MKLAIYTCAHLRYSVLDIYIDWLNHIRNKYDILPVIVDDDPKVAERCSDNEIVHLSAPNEPLGKKFNTISLLKAVDFDYLMVMGSDDICNMRMIKYYFSLMEQGLDFWGMKDIYFYGIEAKVTKYWAGFQNHRVGETVGCGRCLSRNLLDMLDWQPWDGSLNRKLDRSMTEKLITLGVKQHAFEMRENDCFLLDIKTGGNISKFNQYRGPVFPNRSLYEYFPKQIVDKILAL